MSRVAHISDVHFGGENAAAVTAALEELHLEPPDLTVITGDITSVGAIAEFDRAAAWVRGLPRPLVSTPGNHDVPYVGPGEILARLISPFHRWETRFGPLDGDWVGADLAVALVNRAISRGQADAAIAALAARPAGSLAVVACHHPLVEMIGGPMTGHVHGGEKAARRFCEARADLILTGHIHAPFAMPLPYGDGLTHAVGAGTLSLRERGVPPSYNLIEIAPAAITVVARGWTGSHFEPWRTWSLTRRR